MFIQVTNKMNHVYSDALIISLIMKSGYVDISLPCRERSIKVKAIKDIYMGLFSMTLWHYHDATVQLVLYIPFSLFNADITYIS